MPLNANVIEYVCLKEELQPDGLDGALGAVAAVAHRARLIFSAKESVYKCQFPLTRRFIEFHEVRVRFHANSEFSVELLLDVPELGSGACFAGRFAERAGFLLTASWISRIEP